MTSDGRITKTEERRVRAMTRWHDRVNQWRSVAENDAAMEATDGELESELAASAKLRAKRLKSNSSKGEPYHPRYMSGMWARHAGVHQIALRWLNLRNSNFWEDWEPDANDRSKSARSRVRVPVRMAVWDWDAAEHRDMVRALNLRHAKFWERRS